MTMPASYQNTTAKFIRTEKKLAFVLKTLKNNGEPLSYMYINWAFVRNSNYARCINFTQQWIIDQKDFLPIYCSWTLDPGPEKRIT